MDRFIRFISLNEVKLKLNKEDRPNRNVQSGLKRDSKVTRDIEKKEKNFEKS